MFIRAKGIHWSLCTLADGTRKIYWYAWKNGPRLVGEYGSPEFIASYNKAIASKVVAPEGRLQALIQAYQKTEDFRGLRDRTRVDYIKHIAKIEQSLGDMPIKALADPRTRGILLEWRDELALSSKRGADYTFSVLAKILSCAKNRGKITINPCERAVRVYHGTRVDFVWSEEDEAAFLATAAPHLHLPLVMGLWTGQRQGDLLRLPWSAYDGTHITLRQSKSVRRRRRPVYVKIPVGAPLKAMLDATPRQSPIILVNSDGRPWTSDGFRTSFFKARDAAGISGLTFHDLRGTAVTRLALVGCTEPQIAAITGHALSDVRSILDVHYLHRDPALAREAISRLEMKYAKQPG
jgi:integrase